MDRKRYLFRVEAIFFDFEGTLVDSQWNSPKATKEAIERLIALGFQKDQLPDKYSILMNEAIRTAQEIGLSSDEVKEVISTIYDKYDEDALTRWRLRAEARDFLSEIKAYGLKIALVTNLGRTALKKAIKKLYIYEFFDLLVSRDDVQYLKPEGDGLEFALKRLRLRNDNAIFVGNSIEDIHAARKAGLKVVIILDEEYKEGDILSHDPDFVIKNFYELIPYLRKETL